MQLVRLLWQVVASGTGVLAVFLLTFLPPSPSVAEELVTGISTDDFLGGLGVPQPRDVSIGEYGVFFTFGEAPGPLKWMRVAVHPSVAEAKSAFREAERLRAGGPLPPPADIGDEFRSSDLDAGPGTIRFRRDNVTAEFGWSRGNASARELARTMDELITGPNDICPRGPAVPIPDVEVTAPVRVALGSLAQLSYRSTEGMLLRAEHDPSLHLEGQFLVDARELGRQEVVLLFATSRNVIFTKTCSFEVVPAHQLHNEGEPTPWDWPGQRLFFLTDPDQQWTALPNARREWFEIRHSTFAPVEDPRPWRQCVLNDLMTAIQPQWLPGPELLEVREDVGTPALRKVYYASFRTGTVGVIYMGVVGGQFLLYLEQPLPLPDAEQPLKPDQVLLPEWLDAATEDNGETVYPAVGVMTRSLERYRAYRAEGPFEPVRILLVDVGLPTQTDLRYPGYR